MDKTAHRGEIRPCCARSPQGYPTLAKTINSPPRGPNRSPGYKTALRVRQGFAHPTRGFPTSGLAMRKGLHRHAGTADPTPPGACQRLKTVTASLHAASGINSQGTASRYCWMEIASGKTARRRQNGRSCGFLKNQGDLCPDTVRARLWPFWWLLLA